MNGGPELVEGSFKYWGKTYRLEQGDGEAWRVYDGDIHLGDVIDIGGVVDADGSAYLARYAGDDNTPGAQKMDGWRSAVEYLINQTGPAGG